MDSSGRTSGYDLFKLIVAILLLILFLIMIRISPPQSPESIATSLLPAETLSVSRQPTALGPAQGEAVPTSSTSLPLTVTPLSSPSPTTTNAPGTVPTPLPSPTGTPVVEPTVTPAAGSLAITACEAAASRSRLQRGTAATILRRLNFRSSPGIRDNWILTNIPGTHVEVVGGPECVPYWTGAYLWWQIKLPDARIGWSAEGSLYGSFYFMGPSP